MRLFVAVVPPPAVLDDLADELARVRERFGPDDNYRWSLRAQWHLTLAFLGEVPDSARTDLHRRLERAAGRYPPLRLRVAGGGGFGSVRRARVLWAGIDAVDGDLRSLRALAGSVSAAARRCGLDVREGRFKPHLTLARLREPADVGQMTAALADYTGPEWIAHRLELVASHLGQDEGRHSRYETVADWPLTGRADPTSAER